MADGDIVLDLGPPGDDAYVPPADQFGQQQQPPFVPPADQFAQGTAQIDLTCIFFSAFFHKLRHCANHLLYAQCR